MKQLRQTLEDILADHAIVLLSPSGKSILVHSTLDLDIIPQSTIERTIKFCYINGLHFYFDTQHGEMVVYKPEACYNLPADL